MVALPDDIWDRLGMKPPDRTFSPAVAQRRRLRMHVFRRDRFRCRDCGEQFVEPDNWQGEDVPGLTLGHVVPRSWGGTLSRSNVVSQCTYCQDDLADQVWTGPGKWWPDGHPAHRQT